MREEIVETMLGRLGDLKMVETKATTMASGLDVCGDSGDDDNDAET